VLVPPAATPATVTDLLGSLELGQLHYDADFDLIAGVTGQPTEWIVPRGSVD